MTRPPAQRRRVVVTGFGCVSPIGPDAASSWQAAVEGRSGIRPITRFDTKDFAVRFAGEAPDTLDDYFANLELNQPITLKNVYFKSNMAELQPESFVELNHLYNLLNQNPKLRIVVEGHTDNTNTELYNLNLSEMRAEAVKEYLINRGIGVPRIETTGFGENQPISDNNTEHGKGLNRRVVFKVIEADYE